MSGQISVLIIDNERAIHKALKKRLTSCGFEVYLTKNGQGGLKLADKLSRDKKPDVILLDWTLQESNSLEILSKLKHNRTTEHIPVFLLTVESEIGDGDIDKTYNIAADDYITKPFKASQIGEIIKQKLQKPEETKSERALSLVTSS